MALEVFTVSTILLFIVFVIDVVFTFIDGTFNLLDNDLISSFKFTLSKPKF